MISIEFRDIYNDILDSIDFGSVTSGEESDVVLIRVCNDLEKTGVQRDLNNVLIYIVDNQGLEEGRAIQECWFRYCIGSSEDTAQPQIVQQTFRPCGKGYPIILGPLQWGTFRTVKLKVRVPVNAITSSISVALTASFGGYSTVIDPMEYELSDDGVINEEDNVELALRSGFTPSPSGAFTLSISGGEAIVNSIAAVFDDTVIEFDDRDAEGQQLGEGDYYLARVYLASDGEITYVKSIKNTLEVYPELPEPGVDICYVVVPYDGSLSVTDARNFTEFGAIIQENTLKVGYGRAIFDHYYIDAPYTTTFSLPESGTLSIGLTDAGYVSTEPHYVLYVYDADAQVLYDYRHLIGKGVKLRGSNIVKHRALVYDGDSVRHSTQSDNPLFFAGMAECYDRDGYVYAVQSGLVLADVSGSISPGDQLTLGDDGVLVVGSNPVAAAVKKAGDKWLVKIL